ncbi:MAG: hypothetical protein KDB29_16465, partial [Planctomycetes bacterium]|nr:hypothetical protein [Planctomycetota bacterium]
QAAKDWLGFVELPQNIDVRGWLEVEAKLTNLWMSMRVFALGIQSWIEGSCAIFEDSMVPRLTVYSEDKRHVEVANAGFVEVVRLTPKLGEEFWDLCAGKSTKMLYRRKRTLAEKVPSVARFIISDPAVAIEDQVNWTGVRLHPTLTARIKRKKRIPV